MMMRLRALALCAAAACCTWASAAEEISGEDVYKYCKSCHGDRGQGGAEGQYPRIAALPADYLAKQLRDFKDRKRVNKPMIPIFRHHKFDGRVIATVAAYVAAMPPQDIGVWSYEPSAEALAALELRPALKGAGQVVFQRDCAACHGDKGQGRSDIGAPPLVNQYPAYLEKQVADFKSGTRRHDNSEACSALSRPELEAVLSFLIESRE